MTGGGEYEPKDSRKVTGTRGRKDKPWHDQERNVHSDELAPRDQRSVTGQVKREREHWGRAKNGKAKEQKPGKAE